MAENSSSNLSAEQKLEIGSYVGSLIKGWLTWIGIANLAVLGGAIVYIFFILPGKAITEATNRIEKDISQATAKLSEQTDDNLIKFGNADQKLKTLEKESEKAIKQLESVKADIDKVKGGDLSEAAKFLRALRANKEIADIIPRIGQLEEKMKNFVHAIKIINITYTSKLGPEDGKDSGSLESRKLPFDKHKKDSVIRIGYTDSFRALGINKACRWEIKVDGKSCPSGKLVYDRHDGNSSNVHTSNHVIGYCEKIPKGRHTIQVWVSRLRDNPDCYTGWDESRWTLEVMEIANMNP